MTGCMFVAQDIENFYTDMVLLNSEGFIFIGWKVYNYFGGGYLRNLAKSYPQKRIFVSIDFI